MVTELFAELFYKYIYKGVIAAIRKSGWSSVGIAVLNKFFLSKFRGKAFSIGKSDGYCLRKLSINVSTLYLIFKQSCTTFNAHIHTHHERSLNDRLLGITIKLALA